MWYTDAQIAAVPALAALDPTRVAAAAEAAGWLYGYVQAHPGTDDADLRVWGEQAGIDPETFNAAVAVLQETGRAARLSPDAITPGGALGGGLSAAVSAVLTQAFTAEDLKAAAKRVGADVAASATKDEYASAIAETVLGA